ncbi:MAG: hypothetical protein E6Q97_18005 [Desulfurellales bacterium]|nr:MAG: hypothetical protein E6Q97_18005 [Desulfurellales bacterium]
MQLLSLDFETHAIENRPLYPPIPVGLSIHPEGEPGHYYAFGHPTGNNSDQDTPRLMVEMYLTDPDFADYEFVFHNAPFDCSSIEERWGIPVPWGRVHDTMLMAFLDNPHGELSLKPLAELHLGEPPSERDAVRDWLAARGHGGKNWGAYISKAPGDLVGTYAIGDTKRTLELYRFYETKLKARGML